MKNPDATLLSLSTCGWLIVVSALCLLTIPSIEVGGIPHFDKLAHVGVYAALAFCWGLWVGPLLSAKTPNLSVALILAALFGLYIEILQSLTGLREFEWADWFADVVGLGLGLVVGLSVRRYLWMRGAAA